MSQAWAIPIAAIAQTCGVGQGLVPESSRGGLARAPFTFPNDKVGLEPALVVRSLTETSRLCVSFPFGLPDLSLGVGNWPFFITMYASLLDSILLS